MTHDEMIAVIAAHKAGAEVESLRSCGWCEFDVREILLNCHLRVKPPREPTALELAKQLLHDTQWACAPTIYAGLKEIIAAMEREEKK